MSYDDGRVALTDDELLIRSYYFPFGAKHIRYADISQVRRVPLTFMGGRYRLWGSGDLHHWYNFDPGRPGKSDALLIELAGKGIIPVITPDQPDEVAAGLSAHGVAVTSGKRG
jgi:hypothetical protein